VFKTRWFSKAARKAGIEDYALCAEIEDARLGQTVDLGGGVFKKRLKNNEYRAIILAKGGRHWFYEYVFAKNERDNIDDDELIALRALAKAYGKLNGQQIEQLPHNGSMTEICRDGTGSVQEQCV
jgi:hypothetical protein